MVNLSLYFFLLTAACTVKALNATGSEKCCYLPFEHQGQMKNDCVPENNWSKIHKCPLNIFNSNFGTCRKLMLDSFCLILSMKICISSSKRGGHSGPLPKLKML